MKKSSRRLDDGITVLGLKSQCLQKQTVWSAVQYRLRIATQRFIWYDRKMFTTLDEKRGRELIILAGNHQVKTKALVLFV